MLRENTFKSAGILTLICFIWFCIVVDFSFARSENRSPQQEKSQVEKKEGVNPKLSEESLKMKSEQQVIPRSAEKKKKKFPWLLLVGGVIVVAALVILLSGNNDNNENNTGGKLTIFNTLSTTLYVGLYNTDTNQEIGYYSVSASGQYEFILPAGNYRASFVWFIEDNTYQCWIDPIKITDGSQITISIPQNCD